MRDRHHVVAREGDQRREQLRTAAKTFSQLDFVWGGGGRGVSVSRNGR